MGHLFGMERCLLPENKALFTCTGKNDQDTSEDRTVL
jgi:hypothetical protein